MSVEEEEYDIQPGISSVWLVTFSILYIIGNKLLYFIIYIIFLFKSKVPNTRYLKPQSTFTLNNEYHMHVSSSKLGPPTTPEPKGGHIRLRVRGWGSPNLDDWRKGLALSLLCGEIC
jgi:hypothetical protein